jgi:hypothetical protein
MEDLITSATKRYQLQKQSNYDLLEKMETWIPVISSDNLGVLKLVCPFGHRIVENNSNNEVEVVFLP